MAQFAINEYGTPVSDIVPIAQTFKDLAQKAPAGCLVYFTSHGAPTGIVVGNELATPPMISARWMTPAAKADRGGDVVLLFRPVRAGHLWAPTGW